MRTFDRRAVAPLENVRASDVYVDQRVKLWRATRSRRKSLAIHIASIYFRANCIAGAADKRFRCVTAIPIARHASSDRAVSFPIRSRSLTRFDVQRMHCTYIRIYVRYASNHARQRERREAECVRREWEPRVCVPPCDEPLTKEKERKRERKGGGKESGDTISHCHRHRD